MPKGIEIRQGRSYTTEKSLGNVTALRYEPTETFTFSWTIIECSLSLLLNIYKQGFSMLTMNKS